VNSISADCDRSDSARITEVLMELSDVTGSPARIGILRHDGVSFWQTPLRTSTDIPASFSAALSAATEAAHSTALGQMLLAHADDNTRDGVITHELESSPAVSMTRAQVESALSLTRLSGVAMARTGAPGGPLRVAVPVLGVDDRVVAGIEVEARDFDQAESVLADLRAASRRIVDRT
jgi:DNA-binding IclR family transcriptional regulator